MVTRVLRLFGGLTIAAGLALLALAFEPKGGDTATLLITLGPLAGGAFLAGSALLGFAQIITLLEQIERNTRSGVGRP